MADLAVIVVSHNAREDLERCLASLRAHPPAASHEIVVVDNASTDGSVDLVRSKWPEVTLISLDSNRGFSYANNVGIRRTSSELVLLLNSDTVVPEGAIDALIAALGGLHGASIVGPRLIDADGTPELSYGHMIGPFNELRQKAILRFASNDRLRRMTSATREVDWVSGACLLVRRRDAEAAGLLDERYFMYCEDVDFCAAVRSRGGHVYFTPTAEVVHLRGRSGRSDPAATSGGYRRSQLAFYRKHHPGWAPLLRLYLRFRGKLPRQTADMKGIRGKK